MVRTDSQAILIRAALAPLHGKAARQNRMLCLVSLSRQTVSCNAGDMFVAARLQLTGKTASDACKKELCMPCASLFQ